LNQKLFSKFYTNKLGKYKIIYYETWQYQKDVSHNLEEYSIRSTQILKHVDTLTIISFIIIINYQK